MNGSGLVLRALKMGKKLKQGIPIIILSLLTACGGGGGGTADPTTGSTITGVVQKGAFQSGSSITIQELTATATNASNSATANVSNNLGAYSLTTDWSGWTEVTVSGQYLDEYTSQIVATPITLNSIQQLASGNISLNVNLFSHFVAARIKQRVQNDSETLTTAKTGAESELQTALNLVAINSDQLDLQDGDGTNSNANAILLLFSGSFMAAGGDTTLLATLTDDFKVDGMFDAANLQAIATQAGKTGMIDRLAGNLSNNGVTSPPDAEDLGTLPDWAIAENNEPVANAVSASTNEDTAKSITLSATDVDGDTLTYIKVSDPAHGTLSINGSTATYTPADNYNGNDSFTYKANDGTTDSNTATVSIIVTAVNDQPTVSDININASEDSAKAITLQGADIDNDSLTYSKASNPGNGSVTLSGNIATYTPNANFNGSDSFTYQVNDGTVDSAVATVTVTVGGKNDLPVASNVTSTTNEDTSKAITLIGSDADNNSLTYIKVSDPAKGTVSISGITATYTPNDNYNGSDSFTYKVNDGTADSNIATVSITVNAINDAPVADAISASTTEDTAKAITLTGSDIDGDSLTYIKVTDPAKGTVSISGSTATYTPNDNFNGGDSFTYKVNDGTVDSATATVSITVGAENDAPIANDASATTDEDTAKAITLTGSDTEGSDLTYIKVSDPANGTVSFDGATATYTPDDNYNGSDSFTFKVNDGSDDSAPATISITVSAVNDAPTADAGSDVQVIEGQTLTLDGSNSTDPDNDTLGYSWSPSASLDNANAEQPVFTAPAVTADTEQTLTLTVEDASNEADTDTVKITILNLPGQPQNVQASAGDEQATISWDNVSDATGYDICSATESISDPANCATLQEGQLHTSQTSPATITGLTNNTTYYFVVIPKNANGDGEVSTQVSATPGEELAFTLEDLNRQVYANEENETLITFEEDGTGFIFDDTSKIAHTWSLDADGLVSIAVSGGTIGLELKSKNENQYEVLVSEGSDSEMISLSRALPLSISMLDGKILSTSHPECSARTVRVDGDEAYFRDTCSGFYFESTDDVYNASSLDNTIWFEDIDPDINKTKMHLIEGDITSGRYVFLENPHTSYLIMYFVQMYEVDEEMEQGVVDEPQNVQIVEGDSLLTISWDEVANATEYDVCYTTASYIDAHGCFTGTGAGVTLLENQTSATTINGLENGQTYLLMVLPKNSSGYGFTTVEFSATPQVSVTPESTGKLNDTGITLCGDYAYDGSSSTTVAGHTHSNSEDCANNLDAEGDPIPPGQDATHGRDADPVTNDDSDGHKGFSFTKLDENGVALADQSSTEFSCVKDNVTGLIWEVKTDDGGLHDKNDRYTWYNSDTTTNGGSVGFARQSDSTQSSPSDNTCSGYTDGVAASYCNTEAYVARVNASNSGTGLCGAIDWRMPTWQELHSIVNYNRNWPTIDMSYFPNTRSASHNTSERGWTINFFRGLGYAANASSNTNPVRLVRSKQQ